MLIMNTNYTSSTGRAGVEARGGDDVSSMMQCRRGGGGGGESMATCFP